MLRRANSGLKKIDPSILEPFPLAQVLIYSVYQCLLANGLARKIFLRWHPKGKTGTVETGLERRETGTQDDGLGIIDNSAAPTVCDDDGAQSPNMDHNWCHGAPVRAINSIFRPGRSLGHVVRTRRRRRQSLK